MKKFLSIFLATAMLISLIPAVFAADTEAEETPVQRTYNLFEAGAESNISLKSSTEGLDGYTFLREIDGTNYYSKDEYWKTHGERGWRFFDASDATIKTTFRLSTAEYLQVGKSNSTVTLDFALSLEAPKISGFYIPEMKGGGTGSSRKTINWYLDLFSSGESTAAYKNTADLVFSGNKHSGEQYKATKAIYSNPDDEIISWVYNDVSHSYYFYFITLNPILDPDMTTVIDNGDDTASSTLSFDLADGDTTNDSQKVALATTVSGKDSSDKAVENMPVSNNFITYKSSDDTVATVTADGTITAVGGGTATIYAESSDKKYNSLNNGIVVTVTAPAEPEVTPVYEEAFGEDTYEIEENVNVNPIVNVVAYAKNETLSPTTLSAIKNGDVYEVKTDATIGDYTFRYWARGLENAEKGNKRIVSLENNFTYSAEKGDANWLIAVYTKDGEEAETEYFNANGQLIPDATEETRPYMLGYGYATDWKNNGNGIKEAVYGNGVQSYNITVNGKEDTYTYGTRITCPTVEVPENKYFWGWTKKVGNAAAELVSTDMDYTFYAWEDCVVEPMFGDSELVRGDIIARKILISKLDIGNNESVIKAEFIGFGDAVERGITLGAKDYAMTRDDATQFAIINNVNATEISAYAILSDGTKYIYTYVAPTAE